jgi:acyl transferase domain-containing protein
MTYPSSDAQEVLMRRAYSLAGITDFSQTAFIETHGMVCIESSVRKKLTAKSR